MLFVYPFFLVTLLLSLIPVALHLWNLKRAKVEYFSNISLLRQVLITSHRKSKIKNILLLIARIGFLVLLTIGFAKIYFLEKSNFEPKASEWVVKADLSCSVVSETDNINSIHSVFTKLAINPQSLLEKRTQDCSNSGSLLSDFLNQPSSYKEQKVLLSDFQKNFFDGETTDEHQNIVFVKLKSPSLRSNVYVDSIWLKDNYFRKDGVNTLIVQLQNSGQNLIDQVVVELKVGNSTLASQLVKLQANSKLKLTFQLNGQNMEVFNCQIRLDDGSWTFDNVFNFALTPIKNLPISLLTDKVSNNPIKTAYDQESVFKCSVLNGKVVENSKNAALYILESEKEPSKSILLDLFELVKNGKTAVIIPSKQWSEETFSFINSELGYNALSKSKKDTIIELALPNTKNPFFDNIFEQIPIHSQSPYVRPVVYQSTRANRILDLKDGNVGLGEYMLGKGKLAIFAFGLGIDETFSRNAIFLPIFYRLAERAAHNVLPLYVRKNQKSIEFGQEQEIESNLYHLKGPLERVIPEQRVVSGNVQLFLPRDLPIGLWQVFDKNEKSIGYFGNNAPIAESQLDFLSVEEVKEKFSNNKGVQIMSFEEFKANISDFGEKQHSLSPWRYVVAISFLFLLTEIIISKYFRKDPFGKAQASR